MKRLIGLFLVAVAGGAVALGAYKLMEQKRPLYTSAVQQSLPLRPVNYIPGAAFDQPDFEMAASISVHAVVHIKTEFQRKSNVYDDFFNLFNFGQGMPNQAIEAMGSGVIVDPEGYIVTNNHVVQDADNIIVTLNDKRVFKATIVGADASTDLALIKIEEKNLPFLSYGNSDDVRIGEWVLAVGNPFNLTSTVTAGIVSAKARDINILGSQGSVESFIQTDAAVNPGNSGGALVNLKGQLIGINAAIASGTGNYVGYSFAIPANIVKKVVGDFMKFGKIQRGYLGIRYREIDDQFARDKDLPSVKGVYVQEVVEGGAAEKAGMKKGDVILQMQGLPVNSGSELQEIITQHNPGDKIALSVFRDGNQVDLSLTLLNENENLAYTKDNQIIIHGATFQHITDSEKQRYTINDGYKIVHLDNGLLRNSGIREGFIITAIDKQPVHSTQDLKEAFTSRKGGVLVEGVYPNGMRAYYGIGL
ncbi:MAG: Do family serine endopeptidase [Bacteroidetes bacterium]|nr:Do family serine endopeptidase [Bacteroidota bacterium]